MLAPGVSITISGAGVTTEMSLPARVFIASPAVTQLLTASPASRPPLPATGMSRSIAAEGTIE